MSENELKPCPFCGRSETEVIRVSRRFCVSCGDPLCADGPLVKTEVEAIAAWNTRPVEDALRAVVARLEGELAEARDGIAELWNLCEILPHNEDCDLSGTGYCDGNRGMFNSTVQNIMDANHTGEGEG